MTEPMGELTLEEVDELQSIIKGDKPTDDWTDEALSKIDAICAAARAHIAWQENALCTCPIHHPTTASPGDEELIDRLESSCSPYEATKSANLIHEAAARLRSLVTERETQWHRAEENEHWRKVGEARIAELEEAAKLVLDDRKETEMQFAGREIPIRNSSLDALDRALHPDTEGDGK